MSFPLPYILLPYALFLIVFVIFVLFDLYHLAAYASVTFVSFTMTFLFLAAAAYVLFWTWTLLLPTDWTAVVSIFQGITNQPPTF